MSHYAKVLNRRVTDVIVAEEDFFTSFVDSSPGTWIKTSYNTRGNVHYAADGNPSGQPALRGNYAGVGYVYDPTQDVFYLPQPFPSWTLDNTTWIWMPPTPYPTDGHVYRWDESTLTWNQL